jgi:hypothetical protein
MLRWSDGFFRSSAVLAAVVTRGSYRNRAPSAHTITRHMSSTAAIYVDRFLADRAPPLCSLDVNKSFAQLRFVITLVVKTLIAA